VALEERPSGAVWVDHTERLGDNDQVLNFVHRATGAGPALVAIDAPLIVPNQQGARPVDRQITALFGRYDAGCHPAYRGRPGGYARGQDIVLSLSEFGFVQHPMCSGISSCEVRWRSIPTRPQSPSSGFRRS
jgi:predicted RNase H-like nuclease